MTQAMSPVGTVKYWLALAMVGLAFNLAPMKTGALILANYSVWSYKEDSLQAGFPNNNIGFKRGFWHMDRIVVSPQGGSMWYGPNGFVNNLNNTGVPDLPGQTDLAFRVNNSYTWLSSHLNSATKFIWDWITKLFVR